MLGITKIKPLTKLTLIFFIIGFILSAFFVYYSASIKKDFIELEIEYKLLEITKEKTEKINNYLEGIEKDIKILQESDEVKELLRKDLVFDESVIKMDVDERARVISKEVENYLRAYPEMSLKNLQESSEFQKTAVQPVGKEGYSFLFDSQSLINYFHKESRRIGYDYNTMEENFPALWNMFKETSEKGFSEGFYYRDEPDGTISYKYGSFVQIPIKTADGINMSVGTTAYVNDYKIVKGDSEYLKNFNKKKDYHNLILISSGGYAIYMTEIMKSFGTNFEWKVNLDTGLSKNYLKAMESGGTSFFGPFLRHDKEIYPKLSTIASVYDGNNLLGYVALLNEMDEIFDIIEETMDIGKTGETYLVNIDGLLISPLRHSDFGIMVQSINTENVEECLDDFKEYYDIETQEVKKHIEDIAVSNNYEGKEILGSHEYIERTGWCLLVEIEKSEDIDEPLKKYKIRQIIFSVFFIIIFTLLGSLIGRYLNLSVNRKE